MENLVINIILNNQVIETFTYGYDIIAIIGFLNNIIKLEVDFIKIEDFIKYNANSNNIIYNALYNNYNIKIEFCNN